MIFSRTCMKELPASCSKCSYSITSTPVPVCAATGCVVALNEIDIEKERLSICPLISTEEMVDQAMREAGLN